MDVNTSVPRESEDFVNTIEESNAARDDESSFKAEHFIVPREIFIPLRLTRHSARITTSQCIQLKIPPSNILERRGTDRSLYEETRSLTTFKTKSQLFRANFHE